MVIPPLRHGGYQGRIRLPSESRDVVDGLLLDVVRQVALTQGYEKTPSLDHSDPDHHTAATNLDRSLQIGLRCSRGITLELFGNHRRPAGSSAQDY